MMRNALLAGLTAMACALPAAADTLSLDVSSDAARAVYTRMLPPDGLEAGAGLLHHSDDGDLAELSLHRIDRPEPGRDALTLAVGGKTVLASDDPRDANGGAVALGGQLRWTLPMYNRAALAGGLYYAPSATAFSDIDGYQEYSLRGEFQLLEDASAYLGYRNIELGYDDAGPDRDFEDGVFAGLRLQF